MVIEHGISLSNNRVPFSRCLLPETDFMTSGSYSTAQTALGSACVWTHSR